MGHDGFLVSGQRKGRRKPGEHAASPAAPPSAKAASRADRRLEALHQQTGVLAHDFNNLLGVILAANEALAAQMPESSDGWELARISQEAAERGARSAGPYGRSSRPDADAVVEAADTRSSAPRAWPRSPRRAKDGPRAMAEPLACQADRGGLESALLNLCVNARPPCRRAAPVQISPRPRSWTATAMWPSPWSIPASACRRKPWPAPPAYFTTRAGRGGTGLGLAGVRRVRRPLRRLR